MPRTASENVVCLHHLHLLENFQNIFLHTGKQCGSWSDWGAVWLEQSDLGPDCLQQWLLNWPADNKAGSNCSDWHLKVKLLWETEFSFTIITMCNHVILITGFTPYTYILNEICTHIYKWPGLVTGKCRYPLPIPPKKVVLLSNYMTDI